MADEEPSEPGFWEKFITGLKFTYQSTPEMIATGAEVLATAYELLPEAAGAGAEQVVETLVTPGVKISASVADLASGGNGKESTTNGEEKTDNSEPTTTWFNTWGLFIIALVGVIIFAILIV